MASKAYIANLALGFLGSKARIADLNEQSEEAFHMKLHYADALRAVLTARDWGFAQSSATLAPTGNTPPGGWLYEYAFPSDCLAPLWLDHMVGVSDPPKFQQAYNGTQRVLFANEPDATLVYTVGLEDDPTIFSPLFVDAFALTLAVRTSMVITGDRAKRADVQALYTSALSLANAENLNSEQPPDEPVAEWTKARS